MSKSGGGPPGLGEGELNEELRDGGALRGIGRVYVEPEGVPLEPDECYSWNWRHPREGVEYSDAHPLGDENHELGEPVRLM